MGRFARIGAGFSVSIVGLVLLVAPGPGLLVLCAGLAILARDFEWAARCVDRLRAGAAAARTSAPFRVPRLALPALGIVAAAVGIGSLMVAL